MLLTQQGPHQRQGKQKAGGALPNPEQVLERPLGVPLFQEQIMQMAMAVGGQLCPGDRGFSAHPG